MATELLLVLVALNSVAHASVAPLVREADLHIVFEPRSVCRATLRFSVHTTAPSPLEHRLLLYDGTDVRDVAVVGASLTRPPVPVGRSLSLMLDVEDSQSYQIAYRVEQPWGWRFRCPIWLPVAPTQAGPGRVRVQVEVPRGATPVGTRFPLLAWANGSGDAVLGDVPSLVRTPFAAAGEDLGWLERLDVIRVIDALAIVLLLAATAAWAWRRAR